MSYCFVMLRLIAAPGFIHVSREALFYLRDAYANAVTEEGDMIMDEYDYMSRLEDLQEIYDEMTPNQRNQNLDLSGFDGSCFINVYMDNTPEGEAETFDLLTELVTLFGISPRIEIYVVSLTPGVHSFIAISSRWLQQLALAHNRMMHSANGNICKGNYSLLEPPSKTRKNVSHHYGTTYKKSNSKYEYESNENLYTLENSLVGKDSKLFKISKKNNLTVHELDYKCFTIFVDIINASRMVRVIKKKDREEIQFNHLKSVYYYHRKSRSLESQLYIYVLERYNFYRKNVSGLYVSQWIKKFKFKEYIESQFFSEIITKIQNVIALADFFADVSSSITKVGEFIRLKVTQAADLFGITEYGFSAKCGISLLIIASLVSLCYHVSKSCYWVLEQLISYFCPKANELAPLSRVVGDNEIVSQIDTGLLAYVFTLGGLIVFDKRATFTSKLGAARTAGSIFESCLNLMGEFIDWCAFNTFGVKLFGQEDGAAYVMTLLKDCQAFVNEPKIDDSVLSDPTKANKCIELYESLLKCKYDIIHDSKAYGNLFTHSFSELCNKLRALYMSVLNSSCLIHQRPIPVVIYANGAAKQGKTSLMNYIMAGVHHLLKNDMELEDILDKNHFATKFEPKMVFARTAGEKYWEGYRGQWAVTYDEIFSQKDAAIKEITASELLRGADSSAYLLNMAFGDKGTKYFTSSLILATANNWDLDNVGLVTSDGLRRRITFPIEVKRVGHFDPKAENPNWDAWEITIAPPGFTNGHPPESYGFNPDYQNRKVNIMELIHLVYYEMKNRYVNETISASGVTLDWEKHCLNYNPVVQSQMFRGAYNYAREKLGFSRHVLSGIVPSYTVPGTSFKEALSPINLTSYPTAQYKTTDSAIYKRYKSQTNVDFSDLEEHAPSPVCAECGNPWDHHKKCKFYDTQEWACSTFNGGQNIDAEGVFDCLVCNLPKSLHALQDIGEYETIRDHEFQMSNTCICGHGLDSGAGLSGYCHRSCDMRVCSPSTERCDICFTPTYHHRGWELKGEATMKVNPAECMLDYFTTLGMGVLAYFAAKYIIIDLFKKVYNYFWAPQDETSEVMELQHATYTKYRDAIPKPKFTLTKAESQMGDQDANLVGRCTTLLDNVKKVTFSSDNGDQSTFIFMVSPNMGVVTSHSYLCLQSIVNRITIELSEEVSVHHGRTEFKIRKLSGDRDGAIITFNCAVQGIRNVIKQIIDAKRDVIPSVHRLMKMWRGDKETMCYQGGGDATWFDKSVRACAVYGTYQHMTDMSGYYILRGAKGMPGYCGFPIMSFDNKFHNKPVIGIHVGRVGDDSVICPLFASDFQEFEIESQTQWVFPNAEHFSDEVLTKGPPGTVSFNKPKYNGNIAEKSELNKSPLFDYLPPEWHIVRPRVLRGLPGMSPLTKAHAKIGRFPNRPMPELLGQMLDFDPGLIFEGFVPKTGKFKMISFEEALFGNIDDVGSLEASSSAGYPHVQKRERSKKRDWFDPSTGWYDPQLKLKVEAQIEDMKQGVLFTQTVCDQLKDELGDLINTNPFDYDNLKTRLFGVVEMECCIRTKMIFGHFITMTKKHRIFGSVTVATNPHNIDWKMLHDKVFRFGRDRSIGGDIKSMDVSTRRYMFVCAVRFFEWYYALKRGSPEWFLIYSALFTVVSSVHVIHDVAYMTNDGNSSGNWITTFFNCLAVWIYLSTCFYYRRPIGCDHRFHEKVSEGIYGDDNLGSVHPDVNYFNNITLSEDMVKLFGVEFTLPSKEVILEPFLKEEDLVFLSRRFVVDGFTVRAPLELSSLFGMLFYVRGDTEEERLLLVRQNIDVFLQEMVHFEVKEREELVEKLRNACANAGISFVDCSGAYKTIRLEGYMHPTH